MNPVSVFSTYQMCSDVALERKQYNSRSRCNLSWVIAYVIAVMFITFSAVYTFAPYCTEPTILFFTALGPFALAKDAARYVEKLIELH